MRHLKEHLPGWGETWLSLLAWVVIPSVLIGIVLQSEDALADASFFGTVTVSGTPVPDGTKIYARVGNHLSILVAVENGSYSGLRLDPPQDLPENTTVEFFVGGPLTSPGEVPSVLTTNTSLSCQSISHRPGTEGVKAETALVWRPDVNLEVNISVLAVVDTDGDGLSDGEELLGSMGYRTEPTLAATDGDGLPDGIEVNSKGSKPTVVDSDCDRIPDPQDFFKNRNNQWVYTIAGSLVIVVLLLIHLLQGLTPGRQWGIARNKAEKRRFLELVKQVRLLAIDDKYDGYIKLNEVVSEMHVDRELALRCLTKLGAETREEYFVVDPT